MQNKIKEEAVGVVGFASNYLRVTLERMYDSKIDVDKNFEKVSKDKKIIEDLVSIDKFVQTKMIEYTGKIKNIVSNIIPYYRSILKQDVSKPSDLGEFSDLTDDELSLLKMKEMFDTESFSLRLAQQDLASSATYTPRFSDCHAHSVSSGIRQPFFEQPTESLSDLNEDEIKLLQMQENFIRRQLKR